MVFLLLCQSAVTAEEKLLIDTGVVTVPSDSVSVLSYGTDYHHILLDIEHFNWHAPVNYAEGTIHAYMEIISKPNDKLIQCYPILQEPGYGGDHWWTVRENAWKIVHPGVYTLILPMEKMRLYHKPTLTLDNPPALKILAVFKYPGGGKADNIPFEDSNYFPMKVRMLWVVVSKGSDFSGWDTYVKTTPPAWVNFPDRQWQTITPKAAGLDPEKFEQWLKSQKSEFRTAYGGQKPQAGGVVITRGGYIIHTWGDPDFKYQSASLGKTFTRMALQLAVDKGLIKSQTDLVKDYWTGAGQLEGHKVMTNGYNAKVRFSHLRDMKAGFPVTNGYFWETKDGTGIIGSKEIPSWATYTANPDYDNYAHAEPGTVERYSSGGYWRLSQALTSIWNKDLKQVLDEHIMSKIGIPPQRWTWLYGQEVRENRYFYPEMPNYGGYIDRPYKINGIGVRGGPGWAVMSATDLARIGLLVATDGVWKGQRLISRLGGNRGVRSNTMQGWGVANGKDGYFSFGKVATRFNDPTPDQMASWVVGPVTGNDKKSRPEPVEVMVPMRDGVRLHTKIWKPAEQGCYPVVFTRAYWPGFGRDHERFTDAGYVYVGQSTRGHSQSEGAHGISRRFFDDADDGYDSLTWISEQPWCDGNIAMYGKSYWGITQWLVAPLQHPNLKVIVPQNCNPGTWDRGYHDHGALQLAHVATRIYSDEDQRKKVEEYGWMKWYRHLPLITLDTVAGTKPNKLWHDYVLHSTYDDYWKANDIRDKYHKIKIPVYLMCGWYDNYPGSTLKYFEKLVKLGATNEIRVVIDASEHLNRIVGDRDLGKNAAKDEVGLAIRWLDYLIKGIDSGVKDEPPVKIFVMGINQWRFENEWPLARTKFTNYYFHGSPPCGSNSNGTKHGQLSTKPPGDKPATKYIYDPNNPVPTLGGNHSFIDTRLSHIIRAGPVDQRPNEAREDVLVFTTQPLEKDTEVTGPIEVKLYAASSAKDTDFIARLIDVYPDGTAYNLTEGIIRARFRRSVWQQPQLLVPGKIYEYTIELQPTSNVFKRQHRIRVHLTSSGFPMWDRNPNTGHEQGMDTEWQTAEQTIYHNKKYPSHIRLPVIP